MTASAIARTSRAPITKPVASLNDKPKGTVKGESLWADAWKRLLRNKAAVLGLVIILLNIGAAVLAPVLAPREYDKQVLADHDSVPQWLFAGGLWAIVTFTLCRIAVHLGGPIDRSERRSIRPLASTRSTPFPV